MPYPTASKDEIEFFQAHGYLVVEDAIDPNDIVAIEEKCNEILANKEKMAFDWAWEKGKSKEEREFRIVQSGPTRFWPEFNEAVFRKWAIAYGSSLMGKDMAFWYDQFLAKPPEKSVPTYWHQDEGYWGRNLDEKGITCWMPFHDVDASNGCMHFIDRGHKDGILEHEQPPNVASDLLWCHPDESRTVVCPIKLGSVTFHHGKMPHMTTANSTDQWRRILTQHLFEEGCEGEGDHFPWKVYVNQYTGEKIRPSKEIESLPQGKRFQPKPS